MRYTPPPRRLTTWELMKQDVTEWWRALGIVIEGVVAMGIITGVLLIPVSAVLMWMGVIQ